MTEATPEQGTHFWMMALHVKNSAGVHLNSYHGTWTPTPGATRLDTFNAIRAYVDEQDPTARGGLATAFDLQPNQL